MKGSERWSDLAPRVISGIALAAAAGVAVWLGGPTFIGFVALICGLVVWELARMVAPEAGKAALALGFFSGLCSVLGIWIPLAYALPILALPGLAGAIWLQQNRWLYASLAVFVLYAGYSMDAVRNDMGAVWLVWLALAVIATDIAGYFVGRALGGPKFWPALSPKKTWSGTVGGWLAAGLVGVFFTWLLPGGIWLVLLSLAVSLCSQLGDMAESAAKRRLGVKDSSRLLPGHGGVFDRFDGMMGGALCVLIIRAVSDYPLAGG